VPFEPEIMQRFKHTAKAKRGLQSQVEHLHADVVLDVADFITHVTDSIELFFAPKPV
jgi:hypothetical protein